MPDVGSGTITPVGPGVPPSTIPAALPASCISQVRYCEIIGINECAFFGVSRDDQEQYACGTIWTMYERNIIARYRAEAQDEIEAVTRYPMCPTWFADERRPYSWPLKSKWGHVIAGGVMATTSIAAGTAVSYATEPATIGPMATTLTDTSEVKVFYPGSVREIEPQTMEIAGGFLTIWIPRCRLVSPDFFDNPRDGWPYTDISYFTATVDVTRVFNDPSTHATLIWPHACTGTTCTCPTCGDFSQDGCIYVKAGELGILDVLPATYSAGAWTRASGSCYGTPEYVLLNYYAGLRSLTYQGEDAIVRLAHSKMPDEPCGCDITQRMWARDRNTPEAVTAARVNCPFGLSDGAWTAYNFAKAMRLVRGGIL